MEILKDHSKETLRSPSNHKTTLNSPSYREPNNSNEYNPIGSHRSTNREVVPTDVRPKFRFIQRLEEQTAEIPKLSNDEHHNTHRPSKNQEFEGFS